MQKQREFDPNVAKETVASHIGEIVGKAPDNVVICKRDRHILQFDLQLNTNIVWSELKEIEKDYRIIEVGNYEIENPVGEGYSARTCLILEPY